MTQVNLLPTEVKETVKGRRLTGATVFGVAAVVMLLLLVFILQIGRLATANKQLTAQTSVNQSVQTQINALQQYADLKATVQARQVLVTTLLHGEVLWSGVLHDLSMVIPDQMWLSSMTGALTQPSAAGSTPAGAPAGTPGSTPASGTLVGNIQFQGYAFNHPVVALWLSRLVQVHGWVNAWITNSARTVYNEHDLVQFNSSVDLTVDATTNGGAK